MRKWFPLIAMLLATLVMAGLTVIRESQADRVIDAQEWVLVVISLFTTIVTWASANVPGFEKAKTVVAAVGLVLNLLVSYIVGGISNDEWMLLAINFLGALGVTFGPQPVHVEVSKGVIPS
jgi:uncharacterized protein YacL